MKLKKEKNIWKKDTKKLSLLKPSLFRNNKMRWMHWRKNWKEILMRDLNWERMNITNFFKDIKMSKKRSRISKTLKKSSSKRLSQTIKFQDLKQPIWWEVLLDQECQDQFRTNWVQIELPRGIPPLSHHILFKSEISFKN